MSRMGREVAWIVVKECANWTLLLIPLSVVVIGIFWLFGETFTVHPFSYFTVWKYLLPVSLFIFYVFKASETLLFFISILIYSKHWKVRREDAYVGLTKYQLAKEPGWGKWTPEEFHQKFLAARLTQDLGNEISNSKEKTS